MTITARPLPAYFNDLDLTLAHAWGLIVRGAADRRSALHTLSVASLGADGAPQVRTVVLRAADAAARTLRFHTDVRSAKVAGLTRDPRIAILGYDAAHKIQLRFLGAAVLHSGDAVAAQAWQRSQEMSRKCYQQPKAPGLAIADPGDIGPPAEGGYDNFTVVDVQVDQLEWLFLASHSHRRARFTWVDGACSATWLAP